MAYSDPSLIRDHVVKVRLNDVEAALIDALVAYTGEQKAALLRSILLDQAQRALFGEADCRRIADGSEVPQAALVGA